MAVIQVCVSEPLAEFVIENMYDVLSNSIQLDVVDEQVQGLLVTSL